MIGDVPTKHAVGELLEYEFIDDPSARRRTTSSILRNQLGLEARTEPRTPSDTATTAFNVAHIRYPRSGRSEPLTDFGTRE